MEKGYNGDLTKGKSYLKNCNPVDKSGNILGGGSGSGPTGGGKENRGIGKSDGLIIKSNK